MSMAASRFDFPYELILKVHPNERNEAHHYESLCNKFPSQCKMIFDEVDTFSLMKISDIHVSYNSSSLLESVAFGIPSVSICGGKVPNGIAGSTKIHELREIIYHVESETELFDLFKEHLLTDEKIHFWKKRTHEAGKCLFTAGFIEKVSDVLNAEL